MNRSEPDCSSLYNKVEIFTSSGDESSYEAMNRILEGLRILDISSNLKIAGSHQARPKEDKHSTIENVPLE